MSATQHNMERKILNVTYKDWKTNKWVRDQTKVMDIMEIIKNRKWTSGQVTSAAERIIDRVQHWLLGHPWVAKEKGGEMNYNSTWAMWTASNPHMPIIPTPQKYKTLKITILLSGFSIFSNMTENMSLYPNPDQTVILKYLLYRTYYYWICHIL